MYSLLLLTLFTLCCGGNAERTVPYALGGSQIMIKGIQIEKNADIKCVVRFRDGRDSIELEPSVPRDRRMAICRLPPEIDSGKVDIDLEITAHGTSTKKVIYSETFFIQPSPLAEVDVKENWPNNELVFTWNPAYFKLFFKLDANIMVQAIVYTYNTNEAAFTASGTVMLAGANEGTAKVSVTDAEKEKITKLSLPYYYVLKPVATQSNVYLSSSLFGSMYA